MKHFQISEEDLAELERVLPDLCQRVSHAEARCREQEEKPTDDNRLNVQIRRVQKIMLDVRWNYQPHTDISTVPADGD